MTQLTAIDLLRSAREMIATRGWTQGAFARDASGDKVRDASPEAVAWSASGAIWAAFGPFIDRPAGETDPIHEAHRIYSKSFSKRTLNGFKDFNHWEDAPHRKRAHVLAALDRAIALAERGETA